MRGRRQRGKCSPLIPLSTLHRSPMKSLALRSIRFYQRRISPGLPAACRYQPTCSQYALEAIERFGVARGSRMALTRLLRCTPLHRGGFDPIPDVPGAGHHGATVP
jgi:uncharacterized protein